MEPEVIGLAKQLIQKPSYTPDDAGCQPLLMNRLGPQGFQGEHHRFGEVDNVLIWHGDSPGPALMFLGHTDVVPPGDVAAWTHDPLSAHVEAGVLYGRGVADMKGSIAAMVLAMEKFVAQNPNHPGKVAMMLTSDEEGVALDGVRKFMPLMVAKHHFDYCLVGEPSSSSQLGDTVRVGRRGSLHAIITVRGKQGHVAYPQNADNPVFKAAAAIDELSRFEWDAGNADFPPTSFQISNIHAGTGVPNIIPGEMVITANFRYAPCSSQETLSKQLHAILDQYQLDYSIDWQLSGEPFHCQDEQYKEKLAASIKQITGLDATFNTAGGTSDGRFVAPHGVATMELGPINKTIHQVNECEKVSHLVQLENIYLDLIHRLLLP
ncbi:succinyl-diaminopimelate desuccinylase [Marinicella sp. S1101]|uniref:succinyl-diaminopimelate desuccinylase n=1 Tax=Marinicella marina TaxID=2996016 RepID=UPI002260CF1A|nr:succinyl-diaminopimelate desuccinylase [Marinicella marina]MCX7554578.1 succinyl-diaminopimelate desuccinylase [Marinicella marina]MDJ1141038.1 succinyl-diaminopimelate desuccinylase [Marinicella marina]